MPKRNAGRAGNPSTPVRKIRASAGYGHSTPDRPQVSEQKNDPTFAEAHAPPSHAPAKRKASSGLERDDAALQGASESGTTEAAAEKRVSDHVGSDGRLRRT